MAANVAGTVMNIILDPLFILVFRWGVTGAALATGLGNCTSAGILIWYIFRNRELYSAKPEDAKPRRDVLFPVISLGLPMAFSTILMSLSHMISNNLLVSYDTIALAAQGVAGKISMLISMIAMGICMGVQPAVSYNYAAENRNRMREIIRKTGITVVSIALALSIFCFIFREPLLAAFIDDAAVIAIGNVALLASTMAGPFFSMYQLCTTYLQATGKAGFATLASLLSKGIIYIPVLFLLNVAFQMYGILFTGAVTDTLSLIAAAGLVLLARRQDAKMNNLQND
jgi:putative MATE family efflux protein